METWKTKCGFAGCQNDVYYYPVKLLFEMAEMETIKKAAVDTTKKTVSCTCTGESGTKHTHDYEFPTQFVKQ